MYRHHNSLILFILNISVLFSKVYPNKYCRLVEEEHGVQLLTNLILSDKPNERIKELASMVIYHCQPERVEPMQVDG